MVGGQGKEESSAADAPHLHYDLATATAEHEHGSDESRSAGHRRSSDGREQGRVIGRAHGPLGKTLACPLNGYVIYPLSRVRSFRVASSAEGIIAGSPSRRPL